MSPRILIVDDDLTIRSSLADALGDGSLAVTVVASADAALGHVEREGAPDLVLSDIRMPGMDGMELLRLLRERAPTSDVVLMTAYDDVATAVEAMRIGAADFLCKPLDLHDMRRVLRRVLEGRERLGGLADPPARPPPAARRSSDSEDLSPALYGQLSGRYRIEREIGRGAMAVVYRALDTRHDRPVAVKVLRPELAASIGSSRFLREIRITARLHHPHILTLIDSGEVDGVPFFVMPFVEGSSLREYIDPKRVLPIADAAALLRDVADALAAAHARDVIHRDIKPENVLVSRGHAWVTDFGIARALWEAAEDRSTSAGMIMGTPQYMSPEQVSADKSIDHRADIYALGVLGYELLTGRPPFSAGKGNTKAVLMAHVVTEPRPVAEWRSDIPAELAEVVMACLAKDPADRWQSADLLLDRFTRFSYEGFR